MPTYSDVISSSQTKITLYRNTRFVCFKPFNNSRGCNYHSLSVIKTFNKLSGRYQVNLLRLLPIKIYNGLLEIDVRPSCCYRLNL